MAPFMEITMALLLIVGAFDHTSAQYTFTQFDEPRVAVKAQLSPLPVIPLPAGLSTLRPSLNRPQSITPRPSSPKRPVSTASLLGGGGGGARPLPTAPKPPPFPVRPSRPISTTKPKPVASRPTLVASKPTPVASKPTPVVTRPTTPPPPPPPPTPTLPPPTRPTPPPPVRPRPRPTKTTTPAPITTTTDSTPVEPAALTATGGSNSGSSGATDTVFTVFKMTDDGSYLFDYTAPAIGLRQREEGFLKSIGDTKVPVKRGFFAYTSPEGKPVSLSYQADEFGFRATGDHLPRAPSEI